MEYFNFNESENDNNQAVSGEGFVINTDFVNSIEEESPAADPKNRKAAHEILEWLEILVTAIIAVVVIFSLIFRVATIDGDSMKNTLFGGNKLTGAVADKVIITNLMYEPKQGDIVVVSRNIENSVEGQTRSNSPIIKRVIAVGGQTVNIDFTEGIVYVDGKALKEDYTSTPTTNRADVEFPLYVPEGYIFVLGDNRAESLDSRYSQIGENGLIDTRYVLGHAVFRIYPFDRIGGLD